VIWKRSADGAGQSERENRRVRDDLDDEDAGADDNLDEDADEEAE
jgi:hypothetical protein